MLAMVRWIPIALLVLCGCAAVSAAAENPGWHVRSWSTADGLPQNSVTAILQTRDGYLWLGTSAGLARFDGVRFRTFGLQEGLGSVEITALAEDAQGQLWIGTADGNLSIWQDGRMTTLGKVQGLPRAMVTALCPDADGTLLVGTDRGLFRVHNGTTSLVTYGLPAKHISAVRFDAQGTLWVSVLIERRLYRRTSGRFEVAPGAPSDAFYHLCADDRGGMWAGGNSGILALHTDANWRALGYVSEFGGRTNIIAMATGAGGTLWLGTHNAGLWQISPSALPRRIVAESLVNEQPIRSLLIDREGALWVGTVGGGLKRLSPRRITHLADADGLGTTVASVAEDPSGRLYAATPASGLYRQQDGRFALMRDPALSPLHPFLYVVASADDGSLWAAGESCLYRLREGRPTQAFLESPIKDEAITALRPDGDALWIGTHYSTLLKFEKDKVSVIAPPGSFGGAVASIIRGDGQSLWIGSAGGLHRWERGSVKTWGTEEGLLTASIRALHRDADGTLWIGTMGGGIARMKDGRIHNITTRQGLRDDVILQILSDDLGHLWLGSYRGIMRVRKQALHDVADGRAAMVHLVVFTRNEGLLTDQCTGGHTPNAVRTRDGRLLFPNVRGIAQIDPKQWTGSQGTPVVRIDEVLVDGKPRETGGAVVLAPKESRLEVRYMGLSLLKPDWVQFRTRLEGLEKDWTDTGSRRSVSYDHLPPGRYVLRIMACDSEGTWYDAAASLGITVQPHYWQTLWFRSLTAALVCSMGLAWYLRHVTRLRRKREAQDSMAQQLLLSQEAERKRLATDLHDGLGQDLLLIKNRLALLVSRDAESPEMRKQLDEISATTMRAIADVRSISQALRPSALEQVGLTHAIDWMVEHLAGASPTRFSRELDNIDALVAPELEINLYRIVQESLNNVMKHAQAASAILTIRREMEVIVVSLFDDGRGFDASAPAAHGTPTHGLMGMHERARLLGARLDIRSVAGKGTRVTLTVPYRRAQAQ